MKITTGSKIRWSLLVGLAALMAVGVMTPPIAAQSSYGSVVGSVTDSTGASIAGAAVVLINTGTSDRRSMDTDNAGNYQFVNLVPGTYRVDIEKQGFKRLSRDQIEVQVQSIARIDARMEIGDVGQTVEVSAQTPLLQTENASLGQVVSGRVVQEMPLNGRNVMNLIALAPGVVPQGQALGRGQNPFSWGNYQISGGMPNQGATLVDGAAVNTTYINLTALIPTQDAVQEFQVQTNNLTPEFGRTANGVVNIATKSGTNQFHGTAYEFLRNASLNANTFYANLAGLKRPQYTQNQFGATLGGPIKKDKLFFFASHEVFRLRQATTTTLSVPTAAQRAGDFSNTRTATGAVIPIYDPLTTCGSLNNPACAAGATVLRTQFPNNVIPQSRLNPTSTAVNRYWALPNVPGTPFTGTNNYIVNANTGQNQNQFGVRGDYSLSDKQRVFARFTRWDWFGMPTDAQNVGGGNNLNITTHQAVVADTYTLSPTMILDVRLAYLRNFYFNEGRLNGTDYTTIAWPGSLNNQISPRQLPAMVVQGLSNSASNGQFIKAVTDSQLINGSITKIAGRHTIKFGGEFRRLPNSYGQTGGAGNNQLQFTNAFTASNPLTPAGTGVAYASYMLGMGNGGQMVSVNTLAGTQKYMGAYVGDTFQATNKLTLNFGVRWEVPGYWTERYDRLTVFQPGATNSVLEANRLGAYKGDVVLVNSPRYPDRHNILPHYKLFAPRLGVAYRLANKTVIRTGFGIFFSPGDIEQNASPYAAPINSSVTLWNATQDGGRTAVNLLNNPYPNGVPLPVGRGDAYSGLLLGTNIVTPMQQGDPAAYVAQWNFGIARQLGDSMALDVAYVGLRGIHLPMGGGVTVNGMGYNQIPSQHLALGAQLLQQVANPFFGLVRNGILASATVPYGQLLRPYPQYTGVFSPSSKGFGNAYHSLQTKLQRRLGSGGNLLATYTWAKNTGTSDTATGFLEAINNPATVQDFYDVKGQNSLLSYDVSHRASISYVLDLPFGKGKRLLGTISGVADKLVSGWGLNGVTTFQAGFPMYFIAQPTVLSTNLGGGPPRPNVTGGCEKAISGPAQSRLTRWFNTSCFTAPSQYGFGNEGRTDPNLRNPGINNFDFAVFKNTRISERFGLQFRAEVFNVANRVKFGNPGNQLGNAQFGLVSTQNNDPRLVQFSIRLNY